MSAGLELVAPRREAIEGLAERIERQLDELTRSDGRHGREGLRERLLELSRALPEGPLDHEARWLLDLMLALEDAFASDPDGLDPRGDVQVGSIRLADVVGRVRRRLLESELDEPSAAAAFVVAVLRDLPAAETAGLLGVSTRTLSAWRRGGAVARSRLRVVVVAHLLAELRGYLTPRGMVMWFDAPRDQLDGRTPRQLLDDGASGACEVLVGLARGGRAQLAD